MKLSTKISSLYEDISSKKYTCCQCGKEFVQHYHGNPTGRIIKGQIYCLKCINKEKFIKEKFINDHKDLLIYAKELLKKYPGDPMLIKILNGINNPSDYDAIKFFRTIDHFSILTPIEKGKILDLISEPSKQKDVLYESTRRKRK